MKRHPIRAPSATRTCTERPAPTRSIAVWAEEFGRQFPPGSAPRPQDVLYLLRWDDRVRERRPESVATLCREAADELGLSVPRWIEIARRSVGIITVQRGKIRTVLAELAGLLEIDGEAAKLLVRRHPYLLGYGGGSLASRSNALRNLLNCGPHALKAVLLKDPGLLSLQSETILTHMQWLGEELALSPAAVIALIMREPRLLRRSRETVADVLQGLVTLGFAPAAAQALIVKSPRTVLSVTADRMAENMAILKRTLHIEDHDVVRIVRILPPLLYRRFDDLHLRIATSAQQLGVSEAIIIRALVRSPTLLARQTQDWPLRMRLLKRIARALGTPAGSEDILAKLPAALTYARPRLLQRYAMATVGVGKKDWSNLLTLRDSIARRLLREALAEMPERARLSDALRRRSLI